MSSVQRINVEHQLARIGIRTTPAALNITLNRPQMKITSEAPSMEIKRQTPTFRISRRKAKAENAQRSPDVGREASKAANAARQAAVRNMRSSDEENGVAGESGRSNGRVGTLTKSRAAAQVSRSRDLNTELPSEQPQVVWDKGEMSINWSRHSILIDWDGEYMPELTVDPKHSIEIFLHTEPYFSVSVEEVLLPGMPGYYVDRAV